MNKFSTNRAVFEGYVFMKGFWEKPHLYNRVADFLMPRVPLRGRQKNEGMSA